MLSKEIKKKFIQYFKENAHLYIDNTSVLPEESDTSTLFVNSGMFPMKKYFLQDSPPPGKNIVTCQKCIRAGGKHNDLDQVGKTPFHHVFFEMLGNFSFNYVNKEKYILLAWNFLIQHLKINEKNLYVTVHENDKESEKIWRKILCKEKIFIKKDNFWQMGESGLCGPCTEIFYAHKENVHVDEMIEIWNIVFISYNKQNNVIVPLKNKHIDTGMGLERITSVMQKTYNNYDTDIFIPIKQFLSKYFTVYNKECIHILSDHIRSLCFIISENIYFSNEGRGYIAKKILRRAITTAYINKCKKTNILEEGALFFINSVQNEYPELIQQKTKIYKAIKEEKEKFLKILKNLPSYICEKDAFKLYDTYGIPKDCIMQILHFNNKKFNEKLFNQQMEKQKNMSCSKKTHVCVSSYEKSEFIGYKNSTCKSKVVGIINENETICESKIILDKSVFYPEGGGQLSDQGKISNCNFLSKVEKVKNENNRYIHHVKIQKGSLKVGDYVFCEINESRRRKLCMYHTATHILQNIIIKLLGKNARQCGSSVEENKLRFDFYSNNSIDESMQEKIEENVNESIRKNFKIQESYENFSHISDNVLFLKQASYKEKVRIIKVGDSQELCGGTHVNYSGEIGYFKIFNCHKISSTVARIEALVCEDAEKYINNKILLLKNICSLHASSEENIYKNLSRIKEKYHEISSLPINLPKIEKIGDFTFIHNECKYKHRDLIKNYINYYKKHFSQCLGIFLYKICDKTSNITIFIDKKSLQKNTCIKEIINKIKKNYNAKGGGSNMLGNLNVQNKNVENIIEEIKYFLSSNVPVHNLQYC